MNQTKHTPLSEMQIKYDTSICSNPKTINALGFIDLLESLNCYEIIPDDVKVKPYFDIEIKPKHCIDGQQYNDDYAFVLNEAVKELKVHFPNATLCYLNGSSPSYICCNEGIEKWIISLHIVISNYKISKKKCLSIVNQMNKRQHNLSYAVNDKFQLFDNTVYKPNSKMRCAFANKSHYDSTTCKLTVEQNRPLILECGTKEQSIISAFFDEGFIEIPDDDEIICPPLKSIPKIQCNTENEMFVEVALKNGFLKNHTTRKEWINMGCALHHSIGGDAGLNLFDLYSQCYPSYYDYDGMIKTWDSLRDVNEANKKPITIASIHKMCKDEDIDKYKTVITKVKQLIKEQQNIQLKSTIDLKLTYTEMKKEFELTHFKIIDIASFATIQVNGDLNIQSRSNFLTSFEHLRFDKVIKNEVVSTGFVLEWIKDPTMRTYKSTDVFAHDEVCPDNIYNLWTPFAMEKVEHWEHNQSGLDEMRNHILILCNNDKAVANYLELWIAQMIQFPSTKTICPTLISKQGAGKGTLMKLLIEMLGESKVLNEMSNPSRDVWGNFNSLMKQAFLVNIDELSGRDSKEASGQIKTLIKSNTITINGKGQTPIIIKSIHRIMNTTNSQDPTTITKDDRRNFVVRSSDILCKNTAYFDKIHASLKDVNVVRTCYEYFKNMEGASNFNSIPIPHTDYHKEMSELSISPVESFLKNYTMQWFDKTKSESLNTVELSSNACFDLFNDWKFKNQVNYEVNSLKFSVQLSRLKISGVETVKGRTCNSKVFNLYKMATHFEL
jgi:hypothetical protein